MDNQKLGRTTSNLVVTTIYFSLIRTLVWMMRKYIARVGHPLYKFVIFPFIFHVTGKDKCTLHSPSYLQWDALSCFLDSTMWGMFKVENPPAIPVQGIIKLLQDILSVQIQVSGSWLMLLFIGSILFWKISSVEAVKNILHSSCEWHTHTNWYIHMCANMHKEQPGNTTWVSVCFVAVAVSLFFF